VDLGMGERPARSVLEATNRPLLLVVLFAVGLALVLALAFTLPAHANGAPVDVFLDYMPGVSNWGPQDATGQAVVAVGDGRVDLEVRGLPSLQDEIYWVWLVPADQEAPVAVGAFRTDATGRGSLHVALDDLPYLTYRLLLITVEPAGGGASAVPQEPGGRRALAGRFPNLELAREALVQPGGGASGGGAGVAARPEFLPVTGEPASESAASRMLVGGIALLAMLCLAAGAWQRKEAR
jgi:hypothetical protein